LASWNMWASSRGECEAGIADRHRTPEDPLNEPLQFDEGCLARAAREGSVEAYGRLVSRHHPRVFAFLLALTRHREDAEDLTQETFLRAWEHIGKFDADLPMLPWLLTIARRQSIAALRKRRPLPEPDWMTPEPDAPAACGRLWRLADRCLTREAFSALWLHYREELPLKEVGRILGKREGAVKVLLHRARKTLMEAARPVVAAERALPEAGRISLSLSP